MECWVFNCITSLLQHSITPLSLMHVHAAVHTDGLAGHEVAIVGGKKNHGADEVRGILIALKGAALSAIRQLLRSHNAFLVRARDRQAWHDRVHTNVIVADFAREGTGKADDAGLG